MSYEKHPMEDLSKDELKELSMYNKYDFMEETNINIYNKFTDKKKTKNKKYFNKGVAALIAVAMLGTVCFANIDRISRLYSEYFGTDINIGQYAEAIEKSCTDKGIKMEILTALNDGNSTYLFVDLLDETGNRLADDIYINDWDLWREGMDIGGGNCRLVEYDKTTGIATLAVHAIGAKPGKEASFKLNSFSTNEIDFSIEANDLNLRELVESNPSIFTENDTSQGVSGGMSQKFKDEGHDLGQIKEVLEGDAINTEISGYEKGYLSNIGYKEGFLHIQMNWNNKNYGDALMPYLKDKNTGEKLRPYYSINYDNDKSTELNYSEDVFDVGEIKNLDNYIFCIEGFYFENVIEGNWEVSFIIPKQMEYISIKQNEPIVIEGEDYKVKELTISPLSINMNLENLKKGDELNISLLYNDGRRIDLESRVFTDVSTEEMTIELNMPIMEFEQLEAIEINGTIFSIFQ